VAIRLAVSAGIIALLVWQIDVGRTADLVLSSHAGYLALALAIYVATTWAMAWRWQLLLGSKGIHEPLGWLTKLYFIGYAAGQVLPTSLGGDAVRIVEHGRRRPTQRAEAAGAVLMERVLGAAGTLLLVAVGLAIAAGRYDDIEVFVWMEVVSVAAVVILAVLLFSRTTRRHLRERVFPLGRRIRIESVVSSLYEALHSYRSKPGTIAIVLAVTISTQLVRIMAIWLCGEAVGESPSPLAYIVVGPLLFLVMLIPFTINGLGAREAFFLAFLPRFGVSNDAAVATGFLFYAVTVATAVPGGLILLWRSLGLSSFRARFGERESSL
jgi:uncharacterized protein (TIRG00374 family)